MQFTKFIFFSTQGPLAADILRVMRLLPVELIHIFFLDKTGQPVDLFWLMGDETRDPKLSTDNHSISCCFFNIFVYSRDDLARAIKKLHVMGSGFQVIPVGKKQLVQSVPGELSMDHTAALQLAQVTTLVTFPTPVL